MKKASLAALTCVLLAPFGTIGAQDLATIAENCDGCHGANGVSQWDDMPTIAGIDAFSHSEALFIYKDGDRACNDSDYRTGDTSRAATNSCSQSNQPINKIRIVNTTREKTEGEETHNKQ